MPWIVPFRPSWRAVGAALGLVALLAGCQTSPGIRPGGHPEAAEPASPWTQAEKRCESAGMQVGSNLAPVDGPRFFGGTQRYYRTVNLICVPK